MINDKSLFFLLKRIEELIWMTLFIPLYPQENLADGSVLHMVVIWMAKGDKKRQRFALPRGEASASALAFLKWGVN